MTKMDGKPTLEQRAVSALSDEITAAAVRALLDEVTSAIAQTKAEVTLAKEQGFDPTQSPDAKAARERWEDAQFMLGRLETLQSRLGVRHQELYDREQAAAYRAKRDALQSEGDALEEELSGTYRAAAAKIIDAFKRAADFQDRAARELPPIPPNTAALRKFGTSTARLLEKVLLIDESGEQIWPPPAVNFAVAAVAAMSFPSISMGQGNPIGPGWELPDAQAQFRSARERERAEQGKRYEQMTREQEQRQNAEERQRFAASQRRQ